MFLMGYAGDPSCVHYKSRFIISRGQNNESTVYYIAGKFGGEFNLAVWRSPTATPNIISAKLTSAISARKNYILKFCFAIANRQI